MASSLLRNNVRTVVRDQSDIISHDRAEITMVGVVPVAKRSITVTAEVAISQGRQRETQV